jgi:hypothetical protein
LPAGERKGRLVQARVPDDLDETLRAEAKQKRVSVSQLIRNVLEDTFNLVEHTIAEAANLGQTVKTKAADLGNSVKRDAQRIATSAKGVARPDESPRAANIPLPGVRGYMTARDREALIASVAAWQAVIVNRPTDCAQCNRRLNRGDDGALSIGGPADAPRLFLCQACAKQL